MRLLEDAAGESGIALLRDQLGWVVGSELGEEEEVGGGDGIAQELDALADERGDGEELFRRGMEASLLKEGLEVVGELVDRQGADVLGVQPDGLWVKRIFFRKVDDGVGAVDAFESESGDELIESEELAVVLG